MDLVQFLDMIVHVDKSLDVLLAQYGVLVYAILFAIVFAETGVVVLFFLPGDTLLFIGGAFCATGHLHPAILMALLIFAAVLGNTTNYWIGKRIGDRMFTHDYRWINKEALQRTHAFYEKHGGKTIILARFVPVVRTFAPFVAGVSEMTFKKFQLFNVTGACIWVISLVTAGYFFGTHPLIRNHLNTIVIIGTLVAIAPVALGGMWKLWQRTGKSR
ncbi:MAG TPA: VTT domain-containing protein [Burkholderiaceae bacterium]